MKAGREGFGVNAKGGPVIGHNEEPVGASLLAIAIFMLHQY